MLELMITLVIAGLLASIAIPTYARYSDRAKNEQAIADITAIASEIDRFRRNNHESLPNSLAELPAQIPLDPWGRKYRYMSIVRTVPGRIGPRKDHNLILNTDFDLYSVGKDGESAFPLSAISSRDDIIRANDGAFIGRAEDY